MKIPQDLAIIGFDDIPLAVHMSPSLSTVRQPMRLQGQIAAELLLKRIESENSIEREERILNCELIIRESTVSLKN
jgi:DNA-binding LacI/PurR family transcriptional regulator